MGECGIIPAMEIKEILKEIEPILEDKIRKILEDFVKKYEEKTREISLLERIIRVEEELVSLRKIESARFEAMEKRFESLQREMDKRFEAIDKRFKVMNERFEILQREMDKRFDVMEKRFESLEKRLSFTQWFIGAGFTLIVILITILKFVK